MMQAVQQVQVVQIGDEGKRTLSAIFTAATDTGKSGVFQLGDHHIRATNGINPGRSEVRGHELRDMKVVCFSGDDLSARLKQPIDNFAPLLSYFRGIWLVPESSAPAVRLPAGIHKHADGGARAHLVGFALSRTTGTITTLVVVPGRQTKTGEPLLAVVPFDRDKLALA